MRKNLLIAVSAVAVLFTGSFAHASCCGEKKECPAPSAPEKKTSFHDAHAGDCGGSCKGGKGCEKKDK